MIPWINRYLDFRVEDLAGHAVDVNTLPSLIFAVVVQNLTYSGPSGLATWGVEVPYWEATKDLAPHGLQEGEVMPT